MITVTEADRLLSTHIRLMEPVPVPLAAATGRILREDVAADRAYPPFDRVAMDGIAILRSTYLSGRRQFAVHGLQRAGEPAKKLEADSACFEVMTGAVLPDGCDAVIRYEDLQIADGAATIKDDLKLDAMHNVHTRGSDQKQGELILKAGTRIRSTHIAALASVGKASVLASALPRIVILSTGDELVDVGAPVLPHQIRKSNAHAIHAAVQERGYAGAKLMHAADDRIVLTQTLTDALAQADVLILSGGVSMGKFDLVPEVLTALGVRNVFHKIAQKPGKPMWFGVSMDNRPVFGLPGNPVSVLVCLYRYVLPYLEQAAGSAAGDSRSAVLKIAPKKSDLTLFVPVRMQGIEVHKVAGNGSGDFLSLLPSDGFVQVNPGVENADAGIVVNFYPWSPG